MTDDESTRPISVAELLAKNGTSAAPPAGGHRRRRRGNSDEVSVAELTGEIPVIRTGEIPVVPEESTADAGDAEAKPEAKPDLLEVEESDAEQMAPDPVDESAVLLKIAGSQNEPDTPDDEGLQAHLPAAAGALVSGWTGPVPDARAGAGGGRGGWGDEPPDGQAPAPGKLAALWRACLAVLQSLFAVAFGAGLFIAFDQLWRWNNIVALVLSVLVILGLVVAVRVVRKTEDIVSTLIAVAVGALVTLGPLALLQSI